MLAALTYFVEYIAVLWATGELAAQAEEFEDAIEILAFDFMMNYIDVIKNTILTCGIIALAVAVVMIIIGCVLHAVRRNNAMVAK